MAVVTLAPNVYPAGTLAGSPVEVVKTYTTNGGTEFTAAIPIPWEAKAGDLVYAEIAFAATGTSSVGTITSTPSGFFTNGLGNFSFNGAGSGMCEVTTFYRVVQDDSEAGRVVAISWPASLQQLAWGIIVRTCRFVDPAVIFDVPPGSATSGTTPQLNSSTGTAVTLLPGTLVLGALAAEGATVGVGLSAGPLPGWRSGTSIVEGGQPNLAFVSGMMDMPVGGTYLGAGCQFSQGSTPVNTNWVGILSPLRAQPAPDAPQLVVDGTSVDAAGVAGTPMRMSWIAAPTTHGQGDQDAWVFARAPTGTSSAQFWNADWNEWTSSQYANVSTDKKYEFPLEAWVNDNGAAPWDVYLGIRDGKLGQWSALAGPVTITADNPPSVTGVAVANPNTSTPTLSWTEALIGTQVTRQAKVFTADQLALPNFDPTNLLTGQDAEFEGGIGTWAGPGALPGLSHPLAGGNLRLMFGGSGGFASHLPVPFKEGTACYASAWVFADATPRSAHLLLQFYDAAGNILGNVTGASVTDSVSVYKQLTVSGTSPAGTATAQILVVYPTAGASEVHRVDSAYLAATPVPTWDSGVSVNSSLSVTTAALTGGKDYTAYVQVRDVNGQLTPWLPVTGAGFSNSPTATWYAGFGAPQVPTLSTAPAQVAGSGAPRVAAKVSGTATTAKVEYSDDKVTWAELRSSPVALAGSPTVYDDDAPPGQVRWYRATGYTGTQHSLPTAAVPAVAPLGQWWLRRPLTGDSMRLRVARSQDFKVKVPEAVTGYDIEGSGFTKFVSDSPVRGDELSLLVTFVSEDERAAFDAMRRSRETLLLQTDQAAHGDSAKVQWYVRMPKETEHALKPHGSRLAGKPWRELPLTLVEQPRP